MIAIVEGFRRNNMTRTFLHVHFICTRIISLEPRENTLHYPHVTEEQTEASLVWAARPEWRGRDWNPGLLAPGVPRIRCLPLSLDMQLPAFPSDVHLVSLSVSG